MIRVPINPELLSWARQRAGLAQEDLTKKFAKLPDWETGAIQPTLKQLEAFARSVHVPEGYLFLSKPPEEKVPIPDFRTVAGQPVTGPSPNLLDTIYACQERQDWYREFARASAYPEPSFVNSATVSTSRIDVATRMWEILGFRIRDRKQYPTWTEALRSFIRQAEDAGVLVMVNGVVLNNNRRRLDPNEFRGFALSDPIAPLIFVNASDAKAAQMFTLAHELAHLWLGASALSSVSVKSVQDSRQVEQWCNAVAAEFLVSLDSLRHELRRHEPLAKARQRLASTFNVSTLVILRRLFDAGEIERYAFNEAWEDELAQQVTIKPSSSSGGNFYRTALVRVGRRFARALVVSTLEGQTLYRDALRMLGIKNMATFESLGRELGVIE